MSSDSGLCPQWPPLGSVLTQPWNEQEASPPGSWWPLPAPAAFGSCTVTQGSTPSELGRASPACCCVDVTAPLWLVNLPCRAMLVLLNWPCLLGPQSCFPPQDPVQSLSQTWTCFLPWFCPPSPQGLTRLRPIPGTASQNSLYSDSFGHTPASFPRKHPGPVRAAQTALACWSLNGNVTAAHGAPRGSSPLL